MAHSPVVFIRKHHDGNQVSAGDPCVSDYSVVRGAVYLLDPEVRAKEHRHAVKVLRTLIPETLRPEDPAPFRDIVLRIHLDNVRGRAATSAF